MSEAKCEVCGRQKWTYMGESRNPAHCMIEMSWCEPRNAAEHWRLGCTREHERAEGLAGEVTELRLRGLEANARAERFESNADELGKALLKSDARAEDMAKELEAARAAVEAEQRRLVAEKTGSHRASSGVGKAAGLAVKEGRALRRHDGPDAARPAHRGAWTGFGQTLPAGVDSGDRGDGRPLWDGARDRNRTSDTGIFSPFANLAFTASNQGVERRRAEALGQSLDSAYKEGILMDADYSQSDMSRLTTMLTKTGTPFERGTAAGAVRTVELLGVVFWFVRDGTLERVTNAEEAAP